MDKNNIRFNQALHGYEDGHTLLAASIDLSAEVKRAMLPISDMSGSRMVVGFEEYITGYPIKEMNFYALSKTWYAPEMKRPGCVWTHTIFIDFKDVPMINNINFLLQFFKRPSKIKLNLEYYTTTLSTGSEINIFDDPLFSLNYFTASHVKTILNVLYKYSNKSIFISAIDSNKYEKLFLAIWRQQWPRLKRNFSFCTGAMSPRFFAGKLLDLQVVLPQKSEGFSYPNFEALTIYENVTSDLPTIEWVDLAFENLLNSSPKIKHYFNYFGSDLSLKRTEFRALAETYIYFQKNQPQLEDCIYFLANQFPSPSEANNLKSTILGNGNPPFNDFLPTYSEKAILYYLTITDYFSCFDYLKLNYEQRFLEYFRELSDQSIKLLKEIISHGPNPFGEKSITHLVEVFEETEGLNKISADKQLSSIFINLNPKLTYNQNFWISNINNQVEIINSLQKSQYKTKINWQIIINILIHTNSTIDPSIFDGYGNDISRIILNTINEDKYDGIGKNWLNYLKCHQQAVLDWLNQKRNIETATLQILVNVLDPNSRIVIANKLAPWLYFFSKLNRARYLEIPIDVHAFCLAFAFNVNEEESRTAFEISFEIIYFALASEKLDFALWRNIEVHTKPLSFWKDWDKCKKMINAVIDHYLKNRWSIQALVYNIYSEELKQRILHQFKKRNK